MHDRLQSHVLVKREVAGHVLQVADRSDQDIRIQLRVFAEKSDCDIVPIDDLMPEIWIPGQELANEAAASGFPPDRGGIV